MADFEEFFANLPQIQILQPWNRHAEFVLDASLELLVGALDLAARGWRVFPVGPARIDRSGGKVPIITGWPLLATTDPTRIQRWWGQFPYANIGIATGAASNLAIVDLDFKPGEGKDGPATLQALEAQHGALPLGPRVRRGASSHVYFVHDPRLRTRANLLPGIDVRGDGGYVVAPPSFHAKGGRYEWVDGTEELVVPAAPEWLIAALTPAPKAPKKARSKSTKAPKKATVSRVSNSDDGEAQGATKDDPLRDLINELQAKVTVDDVLAARGLSPTPTTCPIHNGLDGEPADNPTAFSSFDDGWRWRCWTRCADGENSGDVIALIRRLTNCSFFEAVDVAVDLAKKKEIESGK